MGRERDETEAIGGVLEQAGREAECEARRETGLHARSFKLRFGSQREAGRSHVSLVKPLNLPSTVTGKFYSRERPSGVDEEATERALLRIRDMFERGPRDKYRAPLTTSQQYGWYKADVETDVDPRLRHHLRDSWWLRSRLLVLAADQQLKHK